MSAAFPRCCCGNGEVVLMGAISTTQLLWIHYKNGIFTEQQVTPDSGVSNTDGTFLAACKRYGQVSPKLITQSPKDGYIYYHDWNPLTGKWDSELIKINGLPIKSSPLTFSLDNNNLPHVIYMPSVGLDIHHLRKTADGIWIDTKTNTLTDRLYKTRSIVDSNNVFWASMAIGMPTKAYLWNESGALSVVDNWDKTSIATITCNGTDKYIGIGTEYAVSEFHMYYPDNTFHIMYSAARYPSMTVAQGKLWVFGVSTHTYLYMTAYCAPLGTDNWTAQILEGISYNCTPHTCVDKNGTIHLIYNDDATFSKYWQCTNGSWKRIGDWTGGYFDNSMIAYCK